MTVDGAITAFCEALTTEYGYSPHTATGYRRDLSRLAAHMRAKTAAPEVTAITADTLREVLWERQQEGIAPATLARMIACFKSFGNWLEESGYLPASPAARLRTPKQPQRLPRVITRAQVHTLLEQARHRAETGDPQEIRDWAILELLYATAIRVAELCTLTPRRLRLDEQTVRVLGKGNKERIVPFGQPARVALTAYVERARPELAARWKKPPNTARAQRASAGSEQTIIAGGAPLFYSNRGTVLSSSAVYRLVSKTLADIPGSGPRGPHTFRHTAATHLLDGGAELRVVQEFLGHTSLASTQVYTHVSQERLAETYRIAHPRA